MAVQGVASDAPPCPDPSAHQHPHNPNAKLSEQASAAALYVTQPEKGTNPRENILGPDGRLSSKSECLHMRQTSCLITDQPAQALRRHSNMRVLRTYLRIQSSA